MSKLASRREVNEKLISAAEELARVQPNPISSMLGTRAASTAEVSEARQRYNQARKEFNDDTKARGKLLVDKEGPLSKSEREILQKYVGLTGDKEGAHRLREENHRAVANKRNDMAKGVTESLDRLDRSAKRMAEKYAAGKISDEAFVDSIARINARRADLKGEAKRIETSTRQPDRQAAKIEVERRDLKAIDLNIKKAKEVVSGYAKLMTNSEEMTPFERNKLHRDAEKAVDRLNDLREQKREQLKLLAALKSGEKRVA